MYGGWLDVHSETCDLIMISFRSEFFCPDNNDDDK